jgi:hypothetical protein
MKRLPHGLRALANCAPIDEGAAADRRMRAAISRAKKKKHDFAQQRAFDRALADLVKSTPVPPEIAEWFVNEKLAEGSKRTWKNNIAHPAILAIGIALAVIAVIAWIKFDEQMHAFPGASVAKKLVTVASSTRVSQFEPVTADAGTLSDLFMMKYRLEHYDVPLEFSQLRTIGVRVFDDEEAGRVAQIGVAEKRIQFFLFPARRDSKTGKPEEFEGWRYLEQEGWSAAVRARKGVLFMATVRGPKKDLAAYLPRE